MFVGLWWFQEQDVRFTCVLAVGGSCSVWLHGGPRVWSWRVPLGGGRCGGCQGHRPAGWRGDEDSAGHQCSTVRNKTPSDPVVGSTRVRSPISCLTCRSEAFKRGGRPGAQKVMIVITDGESHDSLQLPQAVADSERDNITMYAIAVSPSVFAFPKHPDSWFSPSEIFVCPANPAGSRLL